MPQRQIRYYFGRLNIITLREDKERLLTEGLQADAITRSRGLLWGFFEVQTLPSDIGEFICGYVAKFRPLSTDEIALPETHQFDSRTVTNRVTAKARFFLHTPSHIIAYHPFGREISRSVFANRFKELLESNLGRFFVEAEILPIDEERRIRDAMRSLTKISSIHVRLHPSNPSNREVWKSVDERLRRMHVGSYRENYDSSSSSEGLNTGDDTEISSKIAMAEDGYGTVYITGEADGKRKTISTRDTPVVANAPTDEVPPGIVWEHLAETVRQILERFSG
jgi:hypothetical protein